MNKTVKKIIKFALLAADALFVLLGIFWITILALKEINDMPIETILKNILG